MNRGAGGGDIAGRGKSGEMYVRHWYTFKRFR